MVTPVVRSSLITGKATVFGKQLLILLENVVKLAESLCSLPNIAKQLNFWLPRKPLELMNMFIPSRSSIDFSSLATDLSANSARVSA